MRGPDSFFCNKPVEMLFIIRVRLELVIYTLSTMLNYVYLI